MISRIKDKSLQALIYALCIFLVLSVAYDMSFAFKKIASQGADVLYVSIFVFLLSIQLIIIACMFYAVRYRSKKTASYLGRYLFFSPLLVCLIYALIKNKDVFIFSAYVLPMFHKVSSDLSAIGFLNNLNIVYLDKIIWVSLIFTYAISLLVASKNYKTTEITDK